MAGNLGTTILQVFVGDPRSSEFVDHARYGKEIGVKPFDSHEFTDEDDKAATEWQQAAGRRLTKKCRAGVPEVFRGGVWNKVMSPTVEEAGTPSHKLQQERIWTRVLEKVFEGGSIGDEVPEYGATLRLEDFCLSPEGRAAARRLLVTVKHMLACEWCPTLLDVIPMLIIYMPESCAYGVVEELWALRPLFFPHSRTESDTWHATFMDMVGDFFPQTAAAMTKCGADAPEYLSQMLIRMFVPLLPMRYLVVVWDSWLCEGNKVIFRYGLALLKMYKKRLKAQKYGAGEGDRWWNQIREWTFSPAFSFQELRSKAFGLRTKSKMRPMSWALIESYHDKNAAKVKSKESNGKAATRLDEKGVADDRADGAQPFFWPPFQLTATFPPPSLLSDLSARAKLVKWVPEILRHKRLRVVFTTEIHGYNLELLYSHCRTVAPSLIVVEASNGTVIGGFCSDPWMYPHMSKAQGSTYGNGQCFLFRLNPNAVTCRWKAEKTYDLIKQHAQKERGGFLSNLSRHSKHGGGGGILSVLSGHGRSGRVESGSHHGVLGGSRHGFSTSRHGLSGSRHGLSGSRHGFGASRHGLGGSRHGLGGSRHMRRAESFGVGLGSLHRRAQAANESFMMTTKEFLAMGVSPVTANCGLKLYDDLTRGSSEACETYGNQPLVSSTNSEFNVTCVEVYAFE